MAGLPFYLFRLLTAIVLPLGLSNGYAFLVMLSTGAKDTYQALQMAGPPVNYQSVLQGDAHYYFVSSGTHTHVGVGTRHHLLNSPASAVGHEMY